MIVLETQLSAHCESESRTLSHQLWNAPTPILFQLETAQNMLFSTWPLSIWFSTTRRTSPKSVSPHRKPLWRPEILSKSLWKRKTKTETGTAASSKLLMHVSSQSHKSRYQIETSSGSVFSSVSVFIQPHSKELCSRGCRSCLQCRLCCRIQIRWSSTDNSELCVQRRKMVPKKQCPGLCADS